VLSEKDHVRLKARGARGRHRLIGRPTAGHSKAHGSQHRQAFSPTSSARAHGPIIVLKKNKDWIDHGAVWPDEALGELPVKPLDARSAQLMDAAFRDETAKVRGLLDEGADVNVTNEVGATPLMRAVHHVQASLSDSHTFRSMKPAPGAASNAPQRGPLLRRDRRQQ
jgi:hypothetical protein